MDKLNWEYLNIKVGPNDEVIGDFIGTGKLAASIYFVLILENRGKIIGDDLLIRSNAMRVAFSLWGIFLKSEMIVHKTSVAQGGVTAPNPAIVRILIAEMRKRGHVIKKYKPKNSVKKNDNGEWIIEGHD